MTVLLRLKLELGKRDYFPDEDLITFLEENDLGYNQLYVKMNDQLNLLRTCVDILEATANNTDTMTDISTEMGTTSNYSQFLQDRIDELKLRIKDLEDADQCEFDPYDPFSLMITRDVPTSTRIRVNTQRSE